MPYVLHQLGDSTICHYELAEQIRIGRSTSNHVVIDDATVSAHHAVIDKTDAGGYQIRDLDSTNGVLVNNKKLKQSPITEHDIIVIGTHNLQLVEHLSEELEKTLKIKKSWLPGVYYTTT